MNRRISIGLGLTGALGSIAIFTTLFDPFASIKSFLIVNMALLLFGYSLIEILKGRAQKISKSSKNFILLTSIFAIYFLIRAFTSPDVNLALHGVVGRSSGALTYFGYSLLFILAISFVTTKEFPIILKAIQISGFIAGFYSMLEYFKIDPWKMSNIYNATSGLLGNPNFSGAFLSLTAIASIWSLINKRRFSDFLFLIPTLIVSLFGVYTSKALQGVISLAIGISVIILMSLWKNKKLGGKVGLAGFLSVGVIGVLGALQIGPLSSFLYKTSVSERGDMWRTAISMIKAHPLWGIGIERYGVDFRLYRDVKQALRAGPDVFSDNAHNVVLHLMSTGGILLGGLYLVLTICILLVGIKGLLNSSGNKQGALTIATAIWLPIQAQNAISVDSTGVFVWSWILGGAIIALANEIDVNEEPKKKPQVIKASHPLAPVLALVFLLAGIGATINPVIAQRDFSFAFYLGIDPKIPSTLSNKVDYLIKAENRDPGNVTWPRYSANSLYIDKAWDETIAAAKRAVAKDPTDWVSWWFMASAYEQSGDRIKAIPARMKTVELDPWNTSVLLELAKDQKAAGDEKGFESSKAKILNIDPKGANAEAARGL